MTRDTVFASHPQFGAWHAFRPNPEEIPPLGHFHIKTPRGVYVYPLLATSVALAAFARPASAQQTAGNALPDAPGSSTSAQAAQPQTAPASTGSISGTVTDTNGGVVAGASVTLTLADSPLKRTVQSGAEGQFTFSGLPEGIFTVKVTASNMGSASAPKIALASGETSYLPAIVLPVVGATTVRVLGSQEQIAELEVHTEESQRILGVLPNFYSSYDWSAPPLDAQQKFQLAGRSLVDPVSFAEAAAIAGGEQIQGLYPGFGTGPEGYGKRFAAAYANTVDSRLLGSAVFPAIFRQDPRYFYKGTGTNGSRAAYAMSQSVLCRGGKEGHQQFCYSHIMANFAAAGISNLYYPQADRGGSLVLENGLIEIGAAAAANLLREFILRDVTTHAPGAFFHHR